MTNIPEVDDIVWVDFDPVLGTEQSGRRPALVLTNSAYHQLYPRSIVCPITRNQTPWPTKVLLPDGLKTTGAVLADQPRTVHRASRGFRFIEMAPLEVRLAVLSILRELLGMDLAA